LYNKNDGNLLFAGFLIRFSIINANPYFIYLQTFRESYNKWVQTMSMRSGQPGLNAEEYKSLKMKLPCLEEQQKIANFISTIEVKINLVKKQLEKTKEYKKGLLQQMFI
jgi:type I restriction enzyme S subunit